MARLLLVDDEEDLLAPLVYALEKEGHSCVTCVTGEDALAHVEAEPWDLVVLDLMLPDVSGTEVCRRIRQNPKKGDLPIIIVSARGDEFDRVVGFEIGADDYVTKPFSLRELLLRVSALLRRSVVRHSHESGKLRSGAVEIDVEAHTCRVAGEPIDLTVLELRLLVAFLQNPGRAQTRAELRKKAWGESYRIGERAVDTNIKRLRRKLGEAGPFIETVRGVGYRWGADA